MDKACVIPEVGLWESLRNLYLLNGRRFRALPLAFKVGVLRTFCYWALFAFVGGSCFWLFFGGAGAILILSLFVIPFCLFAGICFSALGFDVLYLYLSSIEDKLDVLIEEVRKK